MKKLLYLCALVLLLQGCAVRVNNGSYVTEITEVSISDTIATDLVSFISKDYPSGHTILSLLNPIENIDNSFSLALENQLRNLGYTIENESKLTLSYTLDTLENSNYFIKVKLEEFVFTRMYNAQGKAISNWTKKLVNAVD